LRADIHSQSSLAPSQNLANCLKVTINFTHVQTLFNVQLSLDQSD
jgi:hypothetical protein